MSSCYSIALSLIFRLCVFREFVGREACRIFCSVCLVECLLLNSPRKGDDGWSVMDPCSGPEWWSSLGIYLQNSVRTHSRSSGFLFLIKLVKTCFWHFLVDLAVFFISSFWWCFSFYKFARLWFFTFEVFLSCWWNTFRMYSTNT